MAVVVRFVTVVDLDEQHVPRIVVGERVADGPIPDGAGPALAPQTGQPDPDYDRSIGFCALHRAVLDDGRRITVLDDRGWGEAGPPDIWSYVSVEEIEQTARMVVGPDGDDAESEAWYWAHLAGILREQGVTVEADHLRQLPHDVELSDQVRARVAAAAGARHRQ